jgi:hypothetical protein
MKHLYELLCLPLVFISFCKKKDVTVYTEMNIGRVSVFVPYLSSNFLVKKNLLRYRVHPHHQLINVIGKFISFNMISDAFSHDLDFV